MGEMLKDSVVKMFVLYQMGIIVRVRTKAFFHACMFFKIHLKFEK